MKAIINSNDLKKIIDGTKRFISTSDFNKMMCYIHIVVDKESMELRAEAVDGHRFSQEFCKVIDCDESFECFVKPAIPKIAKRVDYAEIELIDGKAYVSVGDNIIGYKQPGGEFYDLKKIVDDLEKAEKTIIFGIDCKFMSDALNSISPVGMLGRKIAKVEVRNDIAPIVMKSGEKDIKGVLPVKLGGLN